MGSVCRQTTTETSRVELPEEITRRMRNALDIADTISQRPFQTYSGQRIAGFTPDQQNAFSQLRQTQGQFMPQMNQSMRTLTGVQTGGIPMIGGQRSQPVVDAGMRARGGTIGQEFNPQFRPGAGFDVEGIDNLRGEDRLLERARNLGVGVGDMNRLGRMVPGGLSMLAGLAGGPAMGGGGGPAPYTGGDQEADEDPSMTGPRNPPALGLVPRRPQFDRQPVDPMLPEQQMPTLDQAQAAFERMDPAQAAFERARATTIDPNNVERVASERFFDAPIQRYMDPYIGQVLDPQLREIRRQNAIAANRDQAAASASGAYGGSRHGLIDAERERNVAQLIADTAGRGYSDAFNRAAGLVSGDQARALAAAQGNQQFGNQAIFRNQDAANQFALANQQAANQGNQFNANLTQQGRLANQQAANATSQFNTGLRQQSTLANLDAIMRQRDQNIAAARTGSDVATAGQNMNMRDIQALLGIGQQRQASDQANMNLGYEDFLREQNYPQENLNLLLSALQGTPYGRTTYGPGPSAGGQGAGALLALLGGGMRLFG